MFIRRLRDLREDKNFFQKDIANLLCITQRNYSYIETGKIDSLIDILIKLSYIYNTSIDYILGIIDVFTPYTRKKRDQPSFSPYFFTNFTIKSSSSSLNILLLYKAIIATVMSVFISIFVPLYSTIPFLLVIIFFFLHFFINVHMYKACNPKFYFFFNSIIYYFTY